VRLDLKRVVRPEGRDIVLGDDDARQAQDRRDGVERGLEDADRELDVDALRRRLLGRVVFADDLAAGVAVDDVAGDDEVVGVPLEGRSGKGKDVDGGQDGSGSGC
jgi:hypothetical protein